MNDAERFDRFMRVAEFFAARHDGRQQYEWKVTLIFWAAILTIIVRQIELPCYAAMLALSAYVGFWLWPVWNRNEQDKDRSIEYRAHAQQILNPDRKDDADTRRWDSKYEWVRFLTKIKVVRFLSHWSMWFQIVITVGLLWLAVYGMALEGKGDG